MDINKVQSSLSNPLRKSSNKKETSKRDSLTDILPNLTMIEQLKDDEDHDLEDMDIQKPYT